MAPVQIAWYTGDESGNKNKLDKYQYCIGQQERKILLNTCKKTPKN